jgi:hypothetical protein
MKILTAHQPVYLPWLGLFHKIALADTFVSFNRVQYLPKDWNNRNKIKTQAGSIWLTVPVLSKGYLDKPLNEIEINNNVPWRRKHWKSICQNYKKAPYFDDYASFFESVYSRDWQYLAELNDFMLVWFLTALQIDVEFLQASDYDYKGKKSELVLDMCKTHQADVYIFGSMGKDYADIKAFNDADIKIIFQEYNHPVYSQLYGKFAPFHLSVLDLLFNHGQASKDILMSGNIRKSDI